MTELLRVVVRDRRPWVHGLHVLVGALDTAPPAPEGSWSVVFAGAPGALGPAVADATQAARRVLVLWSCTSAGFAAAADELATIPPLPGVVHAIGGPHAAARPDTALAAGFQAACTGEGEQAVVGLARVLAAGADLDGADGLASVPGWTWRGAHHEVRSSGPPQRDDLDTWPSFAAARGRLGPVEITRGCIYGCRFCQTPYLFKARFRHRSVANVRDHLLALRASGGTFVRFVTPTALSYGTQDTEPNLAAVEDLLATAREVMGPHGKVWFGGFPSELRPEHVTPAAMALLRRFVDNRSVIIGAQSGDDGVLDAAHRGHTAAEVERAVDVAVAAGFVPDVDLLLGMPGEDPDAARRSVDLAERLVARGARIHAHTFLPLPGTPWSDAPPGQVPTDVRAGVDALVGSGAAHGQWRRQEALAPTLVPLVRRPPRA